MSTTLNYIHNWGFLTNNITAGTVCKDTSTVSTFTNVTSQTWDGHTGNYYTYFNNYSIPFSTWLKYKIELTSDSTIKDIKFYKALTSDYYTPPNTFIQVTDDFRYTISDKTATITFDHYPQVDNDYTISGYPAYFLFIDVVTDTTTKYTVTQDLTNVTSDYSSTTITDGEEFSINFTPKSDYTISSYHSNIGTWTTTNTGLLLTGTATDNLNITVVATQSPKIYITGTITNASCNYSNGDTITNDKYPTITANEGYYFDTDYDYYIDDGIGGQVQIQLNKSTDGKTLTIKEIPTTSGINVYFEDSYTAVEQAKSAGNWANLYCITDDELNQLASERFYTTSVTSVIDYGQFISNLYIMPLTIPSDLINETASKINLGIYHATTTSHRLKNYTSQIDLGSITVYPKYQNVYDFINCTCILYLPFFPPITLNTDYSLGQTVYIKYIINWYTGDVTYNLSSSFNRNYIFASSSTNIALQIPFIQSQNNTVVKQISAPNLYLINTPRIEVLRNIPYKALNSVFGGTVIEQGNVKDFTGYTVFESCKIETIATEQEKSMIQSQLKAGVYINND